MPDNYFDELMEWSERKHQLLTKYIDGFVRILGPSRRGLYYVDGFAGPGVYFKDGKKGSPVHVAEYASGPLGQKYGLRCINVELDQTCYNNLVQNTANYPSVVTNLRGAFEDKIGHILAMIGQSDAIFFIDPFGIKGIEWRHMIKVLSRQPKTEVLLRINPVDLQRLAGNVDSSQPEAKAKVQLLTDLFGDSDETVWLTEYRTSGAMGLVDLYMKRLLAAIARGSTPGGFVCRYPIRSITGEPKYHLLFTTRHAKGAVLMSDTVFNREADYAQEVRDYQANRPQQLPLFGADKPTPEQIMDDLVSRLKDDVFAYGRGKACQKIDIRSALLSTWFGRVTGKHYTRAIAALEEGGLARVVSGTRGSDEAVIQFSK